MKLKLSKLIKTNKTVNSIYAKYLEHPFLRELLNGTLPKDKFTNYLIQDSLYLKDYAKVYASIFMNINDTEDLQFLHQCIGVVVSDETNMHKKYLNKHGLTFKMIDNNTMHPKNKAYIDYMFSYCKLNDKIKAFVSALPCTLTYEFIGKELYKLSNNTPSNYYSEWIKAYAGAEFEDFSIKSCELIDRYTKDFSEEQLNELLDIYIEGCKYELDFWDMSYETTYNNVSK